MSIIQEISQKIHGGSKVFVYLDAIFLMVLTIFIVNGIILTPFHADEVAYINMSADYDLIVKQGNLKAVLLDTQDSGHGLRLTTGSILAFWIGLARDITDTGDSVNRGWEWSASWDENIEQGNMPGLRLLTLARACSALMGSLSIVFLFLSTYKLTGSRLAAWIASLLLVTHAGTLLNFRRAMQEGPKFLFLLITLYVAVHVLKNLKNGKFVIWMYVLLGVASGITLAAKQDTVPMLIAIYLALALIPLWQKMSGGTVFVNILSLLAATIMAFAFFLLLMPIFWGWWETILVLAGIAIILFQLPAWNMGKAAKPLVFVGCALIVLMTMISPTLWVRAHIPISKMMEVRKSTLKGQVDYLESNDLFHFDTNKNKAKFLFTSTIVSSPMYMEVLSFDIEPMKKQIAAYESSYLAGRLNNRILDALILLLFVIGVIALFKPPGMESQFLLSLFLMTAVILFLSVPLPWQRYFLIVQIPYSMIAGVGAGKVWAWGNCSVRSRRLMETG